MHKVKNLSNTTIAFIKNKLFIIIAITLFIISILFYKVHNKTVLNAYTVKRGDIREFIEVAGKVKSSSQADLNFEKSGVISSVKVKVGQKVMSGQTLATLSSLDLQAQVAQAEATVESAKATLASITEGSRPEEIAVREQALYNAQSDLDIQNSQVIDTYNSMLLTYNDILYFKLSNFFIQNGNNYKYNLNNCDQTSISEIENKYKYNLDKYKDISNYSTTENNAVTLLTHAKNVGDSIRSLINMISNAVSASCVVNDTSMSDKRAIVSLVKTSIVNAATELNAKRLAINTAQSSVSRAQKDLILSQASGDKNKIATQKAMLSQAEAGLSSAKAQLYKNIIKAPFDGVITVVDVTAGELAVLSKPAISIIAEASFEIEVKLSEIDTAKIAVDQAADITMDAFGGDIHWQGSVLRVDPSATDNNGVANYKAIISFMKANDTGKIKPGMTANAKLNISNKTNVLLIPSKYIKTTRGMTSVMLKDTNNGKFNKQDVSIGMRGDDGQIEVLSGLKEGDTLQELAK